MTIMTARPGGPSKMKSVPSLLDRVAHTIERHDMFADGQRAGVAVSGGADSVCLLHALLELAPRWNLSLTVLHLNHQLRGAESDQDAEFVRQMAERLGLPAEIRAVDVAASPDNLEQAARDARLAFFQELLENGRLDRIAVGHTRSDQAETVLFRFLRGSGTAGLAGIRPAISGGIVRPLLEVERSDVEEFLRARGIPWREDSSNASPQFARNRIRHDLLPQLARDWNPAITETLANTAEWALAEEVYWEAEIDRLAAAHFTRKNAAILMRVHALRALPLAAARRLVRRAMERVKGDLRGIDFRHISLALQLVSTTEGSGRFQAPGLDIYRSFDWLRFAPPVADGLVDRNYRVAAPVPGIVRATVAGVEISLELVEKTETFGTEDCVYNSGMGCCLDWNRVPTPLELRNWRPGDQYQPLGHSGGEKIKTLFQEARIPLWERRHWPVLTGGTSIVWSRRFGPAAQFAASCDSRVMLKVRETEAG
jgi:tRNA(Ile)-lysidine synthase